MPSCRCMHLGYRIPRFRILSNDRAGVNVSSAAHLQDTVAARAYYEESLSINRDLGNRYGMAIVLDSLGAFMCDQDDYAAARDYLGECLKLCRELDAK